MYWTLAENLPDGYELDTGTPDPDKAERLLSNARAHNPGCIIKSMVTREWDKPTDTHPNVPPRLVTRWCVLWPKASKQ